MAERSFKREVQKLRLGEGEVFHGEGILAVTKALLQSGVSYVAGYQGAPISHLMDVLADANDILAELGVHFEHSASEATATATLLSDLETSAQRIITAMNTANRQSSLDVRLQNTDANHSVKVYLGGSVMAQAKTAMPRLAVTEHLLAPGSAAIREPSTDSWIWKTR